MQMKNILTVFSRGRQKIRVPKGNEDPELQIQMSTARKGPGVIWDDRHFIVSWIFLIF